LDFWNLGCIIDLVFWKIVLNIDLDFYPFKNQTKLEVSFNCKLKLIDKDFLEIGDVIFFIK
jgi:hypothetical protein